MNQIVTFILIGLHKITFPRTNLRPTYEKHDVRVISLEQKGPCAYGRPRSPRKLRGRPLVMADEDAIVYESDDMTQEQKAFKEIEEQELRKFRYNTKVMKQDDKLAALNGIANECREIEGEVWLYV